MPTYEYKCSECGTTFEESHGIDHRVENCPECGEKVRRVFHPVGIIFKGPGFYSTDSRKASGDGEKKAAPKKLEEEHKKVDEKSPASKEKASKDNGKQSKS